MPCQKRQRDFEENPTCPHCGTTRWRDRRFSIHRAKCSKRPSLVTSFHLRPRRRRRKEQPADEEDEAGGSGEADLEGTGPRKRRRRSLRAASSGRESGEDGTASSYSSSRNASPPPLPDHFDDGTILITYHPSSGKPPLIIPPYPDGVPKYPVVAPSTSAALNPPNPYGPYPFSPFPSEADFVLAEAPMLERLPVRAIRRHYSDHYDPRIHDLPAKGEKIVSYELLAALLDEQDQNPFHYVKLPFVFRGRKHSVGMWMREPRTFFRNLVKDPYVAPWIHWDAEKWKIWEGGEALDAVGEVYSSGHAWDYQDELGTGENPFFFDLFSDETCPASFAQSSLHTVVVWPTSVPQQARIRGSKASSTLLALLPTPAIKSLSKLGGNKSELKSLQHQLALDARKAFWTAFEPIFGYGVSFHDGHGIGHHVRPQLSALSMDLKEAWAELHVRGGLADRSCPLCFESRESWSDLAAPLAAPRSKVNMAQYYKEFRAGGYDEAIGMKHGLAVGEDALPALAQIEELDPYPLLGPDPLHGCESGFWKDHLFPLIISGIKRYAINSKRFTKLEDALTALDAKILLKRSYPEVLNLTRSPTTSSFNNGKHNLTVMRLIGPFLGEFLEKDVALPLISILRTLCSIRNLITAHFLTSAQIKMGKEHVKELGGLLKSFESEDKKRIDEKCVKMPKGAWYRSKPFSFGFLKCHMIKHVFDSILFLGSATHSDTKNGDSAHPLYKGLWRQDRGATLDKHEEQLATRYARYTTFLDIEYRYKSSFLPHLDLPAETTLPSVKNRIFSSLTTPVQQYIRDAYIDSPHFKSFSRALQIFVYEKLDNADKEHPPYAPSDALLPSLSTLSIEAFSSLSFSTFNSTTFLPSTTTISLSKAYEPTVTIRLGERVIVGRVLGIYRVERKGKSSLLIFAQPGSIDPQRHWTGYPRVRWGVEANLFSVRDVEQLVLVEEMQEKGKSTFLLNDRVDLDSEYLAASLL